MDRVRQRLKLLHDDVVHLEREIVAGRSKTGVTEWREILKLAREIEEFAIRQIVLIETGAKMPKPE